MSDQKQPKKSPTHDVFHVRGEGKSAYWNRIGAAWLHDDQGGLSVTLDYIPLGDRQIVIRTRKQEAAQ